MATRKKQAKPTDSKPSLTEFLARAGRYYATGLRANLAFCETYHLACEAYGQQGRKAFQDKYAFFTDAMWRHIELVGKRMLLPQFLTAPGSFIEGLVRVKDSLAKQQALVAMTKDGKMEMVDAKGRIVLKSFDDLSKAQEELILFAMNSSTSASEIRKFAYDLRREWRNSTVQRRPDWERVGDTIRVNRAIRNLTKEDWKRIGATMGWTAA